MRTIHCRLSAVGFALFLTSAPFALSQKEAGTVVQEKASVTLIEIPVNVVGKDGRPLAGLTVADFELFDEGKQQPISSLEVIDLNQKRAAAPAATESAAELPASARRLWLLVFDLSYTSPSGLLRARDGARAFVASSMKPNDLAAVGTLSVDTGWKLLVNFTRDRHQLSRAIDTLGLPGLGVRVADPLAFAFEPPNPAGSPTGGVNPSSKGEALALEDLRDMQNLQRQANDELARGRVAKLVNSLAGIGRVLDSVRGRKHVLFFSEGFETRLLAGSANSGGRASSLSQPSSSSALDTSTPQGSAEAALSGEVWKIDSDSRFGSSSMRERLLAALSGFKRSDAVLDTIDISGLRAEGDVGAKPGSGTDALFTMASESDGDFVKNANQLGPELERVAERTSLVYLLVYQPRQLTKPGAFHALKVKVKASGAKVLARSGYYEPRPYKSLSPLEQLLASGDIITGGLRVNDFPVEILAAPFAAGGGLAQVPVVLEIPGRPLLTGDPGPKTSVQIFAYATDESGTLRDYATNQLSLDLERARSSIEAGGLKFFASLSLPAGNYAIRTLVRNASTGRSAVATAQVRVAEVPGSSAVVLPPFFQEPAGRWTMIKAGPRSDAPASATSYPFTFGGESFIPWALPVLGSGATAQVAVITFNLGSASEPLQVLPEVLGPDGKPRPSNLQIVRRSDRERDGARALLLAFKPEGFEPGRYTLKVRVSDRASRRTAEASTPFEVRSP